MSTSGLFFTIDYLKVDPNSDSFVGFDIEAGLYPIIRVNIDSDLYRNDFDTIKNGVTFVATYTDSNVFTETYVLQNDITLGGNLLDESNFASWTAIGANNTRGFAGIFNGNGYKISFYAKSGTKQNFGLFSKISGTVYNLSVVGYFSISGTTDATSLGAFASEVAESGQIIDCQSFVRFTVAVKANQKLSVSGAIGVNNGKTINCNVIESIGTGNISELVSSCGFDELKWKYLLRLHNTVYQP